MNEPLEKFWNNPYLNDDLQPTMKNNRPESDFKKTLSLFYLPQLLVLQKALRLKKVITHHYQNGRLGCLLFWLAGVRSKEEVLNSPLIPAECLMAVRRTIRWWDLGALTTDMAKTILAEVINDRKKIEASEKLALGKMTGRRAAV